MNRRPRVLYLTYNYAPKLGGLEQVVERTSDALRRDADVVVLAQGARDHAADAPGVLRPRSEGLAAFVLFLYQQIFFGVGRDRFDVVVSGSALTALPALHFARRLHARSAVIVYGLDTIFPSRIYQAAYRYAVPRLDLVISISRATAAEAVARGVAADRIVLIPPGCNGERFALPHATDALRARWGLEGCRVVLCAGRLVARKGVDRLIAECMTAVVREVPDAKLLVAGGNPEGALAHTDDVFAKVEAATHDNGMDDRVVITGRLSDQEMVAAFQLADVFVMPVVPTPGDMEGFGIVLLEAGAAGLPVVATAVGGVTDAVEDGTTGCLIPLGDYAAMSDAIVRLLTDSELARQFGERGRARALGEYSWPQISRRYVDAILGLVPSRDGRWAEAEMAQPGPQMPEMFESAWWRRIGALVGLALFAGLAAILASRWQELPSEVLDPNWPQLICALAILFGSLGASALLWGRILAALDSKLSAVELVHIHFICQTGKYLPGKVLLVIGKVVLAIRQGCARGAVGASVVYEQALFILSGGLTVLGFAAFASVDVVADHRAAVIMLCALALVGLHPFVLNRFVGVVEKLTGSELSGLVLAYPRLLGLLIAYAIPWVLAGVGYYLFVDALAPMEAALLPDMGAVFALSALAGLIALFAPAGIGVREAAMSAMLSAYMPVAESIAVALAFRVALVAVDVSALAIALALRARCRRRAAEVG